ncbi:MAG: gliding motility-associated C-terminal domain-containing protein [Flavobacteriales bacterium]
MVITDGNGCTGNFSTSLTQGTAITATSTNTNINCNGASTGAINLSPAGGNGSYTFLWSNNATTEDLSGLAAGTYSVVITDGNGCTGNFSTSLTQGTAITATSTNTNINCNGGLTGAIDLTSTGGTGSYTYLWSTNATSEDLTSLAAGNYSVIITDGAGCTGSYTTTLTQPTALVLSSAVTNIDCNGNSTGSIDLSVSGGTSPYTFIWSNNSTSEDLNAISAGIYNVTVTDLNGCIGQLSATVSQPVSGLSISNVNTNIDCNGATTGAIDITVNGGTGPFTYLWNNGSTIEDLAAVAAGNYSVTVTDNNGCQIILNTSLSQPNAIVINSSIVDVLCNGFSTGVIDVTVTGGISPYAFSWSNGAATEDLNGVVAGTYFLTVTDVNDCAQPATLTINEPGQLTLSKSSINVSCNGLSDGSVDITVSGGINPYTFSWNDGSVTEDLTNVPAGTYTLTVTDGNGCVASTTSVITEPSAISTTTSSTPASCNPDGSASVTASGGVPGYTYLWSNGATTNSITGVAAGNYTVNVTDANSCTVSALVTIAQTSALTASASLNTPVACNGGTAVVNVTASGGTAPLSGIGSFTVSAGNQSFTVTDANGCAVVATINVTEPAVLTATANGSNITCNGANDGILAANINGGTAGYSYSWSNGQSTNTITNLTPGSYNLTVTDANGCVATASGNIAEPTAIVASNTTVNVSCNGAQDGSIDLTVSGGTPGYTFLWNDPNNTSSEDLSNASAGTYTVLITDNNNCLLSYNVSLTQPNALLANSNVTTPIVVNGGTGVITVGANGGIPSYTGTGTYTVTSGTYTYTVTDANGCSSSTTITITEPNALQATATITSNILCNGGTGIIDINGVGGIAPYTGIGPNVVVAGTYTYTITDAGNATANITITITEPSPLTATISSSNITCNGANNGTATVTASGGTAPYTYLWSNGPTSANVSNLAPGTYSVFVTDANGCAASANVTITEPTPLAANITSTDVTCNGLNNGTASVIASGGSAPYTYLWNNNATSTTVSNLSPGNYTVTVTDANGCTTSANVTISQPVLLTSSTTSTDVTCNGLNNGTASVTASGGTAPYTYLWSNGPTSANVSNLAPGTYSVVVTDANGCTASANVTISQPVLLTATTSSTNISCNGLNNGTASVTASGGTAPYSYLWNNNSTFATVANLAPGNYSVTVTDANGCTVSANVNITEPAILGANTASTNVSCNGLNNGSAAVTASGGTAPYTYLWNNNATSATVSNLAPGNYTVTITDANGCTVSGNVTITQPTVLAASATSTNVTCNGLNNGTANVTASGGTAPYTYLWNNNATSATASNLAPGNYTVTVTDANGCTTSANATISQPSLLTVTTSSTNVTCNGQNNGTATGIPAGGISPYTFLWSNNQTTTSITNLLPGNYSVTITDANNCTTNASVTITQPAILTANSAVNTPILCYGGSATITVTAIGGTSPYTNTGNYTVNAGTYTYTVNDVNGCLAQTTLIVNQPNALTANSTVSQAIACSGGTGQISITASGGTSPYNGTGIQTVLTGTYSYTVTDLNGCTATTTIAVTEPPALSVVVNGTNPLCNGTSNGSAIANPSGGTAPYTYAWSNGQTTVQATNLASGTYTLTVTDANGCITMGSVILTQPANLTASSSVTSPILCFGGIGVVTVTANGGTSPYTGTGAFNAVAGLSTYTVTDANGCFTTTSLTVNQPTALVASSAVASAIPCFGGTGNIIVTATGGTPNYTGTGTFVANTGPHTYTVTDANGCSTTTTITISQPTALNPIANITNPIACNGGFATINVSANGGTPAYSGVGNFAALAGVQNYTVIDANGCSASISINVTQPTVLSSSITSQNVTCNGLNNGSATATGQGGTPNYTYLWSNGATTATVTNLSPGAYSVTVTDANGCQSISNVVITQPTTLSSSVVQTAIVPCFGSTGTVFVSATGGSAPYVGTGNFTVVAGNQSFTVTDVNGCTSASSIFITQPTQLVATASQTTPILCFGGQASVAVTGTGGTGSYTGTGSFNVNAGNNTFTIQDANGCNASTTISITQPTAVAASFNNTSVSCFGFSNGASTATVSGGTPGYSYLWSTGSITNTINNQFAGNYGLQVTDANGCIFNFTTSITQPTQIVATANIILPIACFGGQAIVLVNGAGGTPGYSGTGTFFQYAGTYTYTLVDQNGCIDATTISVTQPPAFTAVATVTSPIACNGGQATVVVTANGGTAPYTGTGTFTVNAGNYTYTLIDANGCTATTTITVTQPAALTATATIVNPILCNGGQATVQVSANGGTAPYAGTGIFNVISGNYNYIVSDVNGCNASVSINVPQPSVLQSSVAQTNVTCNGANNGSAIVFYSGGTNPISVLWSNGATSNSISNLSPGNYTVTVSDANGCFNVNSLTITQPNTLIATATEIVPIACFNGNATVVVSATGGTSPFAGVGTFFPVAGNYVYPISDANGCTDTAYITITQPTQLTAVATLISPVPCFGGQAQVNLSASGGVAPYTGVGNFNVSAGNQSFTVTDANGCAITVTLFITQPAILSSVITAQNVTCFNSGNGSATVTPNGGTPGYQYLWSNGATTPSVSNLTPGLYTVNVTDINGCQTINQVTITQPTVLQVSSSLSTPVFCFGGTATVNVSASGGTAPYTGTGSFQQGAGTITYYVTDANGCLNSTTITVNQPNQLIASASQSSNVLCFGGNATVAISSIGGTPVISGTGNFSVPAGWNNFTVTDSYGCQDTTSIFISQPTLLVANATLVSPILCNGGTAVLNISASGGTPGYVGQGNLTVIAGTYTYNVTDNNGCTASTTITVTQPNTLQAVANITSPIVCNAGTGVITVTGVGGTAPYTGTGSFTVAAGTYTYPISDANGCTSSVSITINQPPVLSLSLTQTNVNCNGFATGSITANPAGGQGPYSYLWSNNQVTQTVTNLLAGSYSVVVTDNLGCTVSANTTITQPQAPILLQESHVNVLCFANNTGSINLSVSGGTSPYTYSWSNSATTQDIQNLIAGTYNVSVTDANGCVAVMSINITQPAFPLTVGYTVTNVSCFGYTDGAIDVTPQGGTGPFTYFWTTGQFTQDLNNIPPGQYVVAITDANNCVSSAQITVTQPTAPLSATISQLPVSCYGYNDGQLTANTVGGTAPYSYVWTPTGQTGNIASALAPGNYIVNITDANGCTASATDVLTTPPPFIASFTVNDNIVCLPSTVTFTNSSIGNVSTVLWTFSNGLTYSSNQFNVNFNNVGCVDVTLLITNTNGCTADTTISNAVCVVPGPTAAFTTASPAIDFVTGGIDFINNSQNYSGSIWQFGDGGSSTQDNPSYFYPASTIADYSVMLVVYDVNGCTDTAYNVVQSNDEVRLTVPNAFTPNGDGLNDLFIPIISNSDQVQYYRFEVYNRWGQLIFETNKPGEGWDGKFKGKLSQFGTYNWKVSYDVPEQNSVNANGHVTLVK